MPASFVPSATDYLRFLPEIIMVVIGTLIMVLEPLLGGNKKNSLSGLTVLGFIAAMR